MVIFVATMAARHPPDSDPDELTVHAGHPVEVLLWALRLPFIAAASAGAVALLCWKSGVRRKFCSKAAGPTVSLPSGRRAVFGDTLLFLLGLRAPPGPGMRFARLSYCMPEAPDLVVALPAGVCAAASGAGFLDVPFSFAYLMAQGRLRREALYAWSWGLQLAATAFRLAGLRLPSMRVAAVVLPLVLDQDALLLTRRAARGGAYNSMWVFPGGGVDAGEAPEEAAAREVREETGLCVRPGSLRLLCSYQARNENLCLTYLMLIYSAEATGVLQLSRKEVSQAVYLPRTDIPNLLSGCQAGELDGFEHGNAAAGEPALMRKSVPMSEVGMAIDGLVSIGAGIGAGHWFALQEWWRAHGQ